MMKRRITRTAAGLLAGLGILAAGAALVVRHLSSRGEVLETTQAMTAAVEEATAARRAFAFSGDASVLQSYRSAFDRVTQARAALRRLTGDSPAQRRRLDALDPVIVAEMDVLEESVLQRRGAGFDAEREASLTTLGDALSVRRRALVGELEAEERRSRGAGAPRPRAITTR
jgi:CHASE3 domain sensor protein